ncbi:glycosyltransferase family 2 protein [Cylindrospermum sp. FACHB-282]|uniref:glycosyltransferase family 2 protein n=1 Tax=Cylindrospermum sp. FACHB-282 TaxID=2692794 RepID=UPI001681D751|nr:glycosyltransferase family A protein [Cylindrospermum sp. FACHB-282]MBD2385325.1 glycosyltransferase family 2 protein [Cylindrospermum sp. FACHB-282]
MIKIAILVPSFNNENTVNYTLESIQSQGAWLNKISSVYLADDCSSDRTVSLAKTLWMNSIPLNIFPRDKNLGQWENVNQAIDAIKDHVDWFIILHSDDIAKANWLEMMVSRIETCSENIGSICSSWENLMPDGSIVPGEDNPSIPIGVIEGNDASVKGTLLKGCWWHISGCAIRVKAFEDCGVFNPKFSQLGDWEWLLRCLHNGWSVEYIPRTLILYRQSNTSVSSQSFQTHRDIREFMEILPNYINYLKSTELLDIYMKQMKFISRRLIKSLITLNTERFYLACQVLFMLLTSLKKSQQKLNNLKAQNSET